MALKQLGAAPSSAVDAATKGYVDAGNSGSLRPVRLVADGTYTHTIASGSVTQLAGTTIDGVTPAIGDRILIPGAPATTGAGVGFSTQPGNGIYVVTGNTTNTTLARATDFSGSVVPWAMSVSVRDGTLWGLGYTVFWRGTGAFTWGTTALVGYSGYNRLQGTGSFTEIPVDTTSAQVVANKQLTDYSETRNAIGTVGTGTTVLSLANGNVQTATLTANQVTTFTMPAHGAAGTTKSFTMLVKQAASTGGGTCVFTGVKWDYSGTPTQTPLFGTMDIYTFVSDGTSWYGSAAQGYTP